MSRVWNTARLISEAEKRGLTAQADEPRIQGEFNVVTVALISESGKRTLGLVAPAGGAKRPSIPAETAKIAFGGLGARTL